jgi:hypothetical protein
MGKNLLALEHDDVLVVLVDLPVRVGSPEFLDLVCRPFSLLLHVEDVLHYKIIIWGLSHPSRIPTIFGMD